MRRIRLAAALALAVVTTAPGPSGATTEGPSGCAASSEVPLVALSCDASGIELVHPFQGQPFSNELAAVSWNLLLLAAALNGGVPIPEGCTLAQPELCGELGLRPLPDGFDPRAGGSGNFGRRDFDAAVPEPAAALLFAAGFALVASRLGRRQA
jgi:hypothetical protein